MIYFTFNLNKQFFSLTHHKHILTAFFKIWNAFESFNSVSKTERCILLTDKINISCIKISPPPKVITSQPADERGVGKFVLLLFKQLNATNSKLYANTVHRTISKFYRLSQKFIPVVFYRFYSYRYEFYVKQEDLSIEYRYTRNYLFSPLIYCYIIYH